MALEKSGQLLEQNIAHLNPRTQENARLDFQAGLIGADLSLTEKGQFEVNLASYPVEEDKEDLRDYFGRGFVDRDLQFTRRGKLYTSDLDTVLAQGELAWMEWVEMGAWDEHKEQSGEDPFLKQVGGAVKSLVTEVVPEAAVYGSTGVMASTPLIKAADWVGSLGIPEGVPFLGAFTEMHEARKDAKLSVTELQRETRKELAAGWGAAARAGMENQVVLDKGRQLLQTKAQAGITGAIAGLFDGGLGDADKAVLMALYDYENSKRLLREASANEAAGALASLAALGASEAERMERAEFAVETSRAARAGRTKGELAAIDKEAASYGMLVLDPSFVLTPAASLSGKGARALGLQMGKPLKMPGLGVLGRTTLKATDDAAKHLAALTARRAAIAKSAAREGAAPVVPGAGAGTAATPRPGLKTTGKRAGRRTARHEVYARNLQRLDDEILTAKKTLERHTARLGGVGALVKDGVRQVGKNLHDRYKKSRFGSWATETGGWVDETLANLGRGKQAQLSGAVGSAFTGLGYFGLATGNPFGLLLLAPRTWSQQYRVLRGATQMINAAGAEFFRRRVTMPYWQRVSERVAENPWAANSASILDAFAKPLTPVAKATGNVGSAIARSTAAEIPFSAMATGGEEGWLVEAAAEGITFGVPGQLQGLIHGLGGAPARLKKHEFDLLAQNDVAELRRNLSLGQREVFDLLDPVVKRQVGVYSALFPDVNFQFIPGSGGGAYREKTKTLIIDPESKNPLDVMLAHEIGHSLAARGMKEKIYTELVGPGGLLRDKDGNLTKEAKDFKREYENRLNRGRPPKEPRLELSDQRLAEEWFAEAVAPGLQKSQKLQKLVRRNKLITGLAEAVLPRVPFGKAMLLRRGVLLDENGHLAKGQGAMVSANLSPALARLADAYLRNNAGSRFVPKGKQVPGTQKVVGGRTIEDLHRKAIYTREDMDRMEERNMIDYERNPDGSVKRDRFGRAKGLEPSVLAAQETTIGNIIRKVAEKYGVVPLTQKRGGDRFDNLTREQWDEILEEIRKTRLYNDHQIAAMRSAFRGMADNDGKAHRFQYQKALDTNEKTGKKRYKPKPQEDRVGSIYSIEVTKANNVIVKVIDMDALEERAIKASQSKDAPAMYRDNSADIMRDLMILAENHNKPGVSNVDVFGEERARFLNGVLGQLSKEHAFNNPTVKGGRPPIRSFRLDRANFVYNTNEDGLTFNHHQWVQGLMPEPADATNQRMPEQLDADHRAAVEAGDMEAAQELVSQAAVEAGFDPTVLYHGVRSEKPFTTFAGTQDPDGYGTYVTTDESYAHSFTGLKDGTPFSDPEFKKIFPHQEMLRLYAKPGRTKITDGENQDQFIEFTDQRTKNRSLTDQGYDSEKLQFADGHFDLRLTNNNQIASADPVTYDDQGNVIPLSERFNPESDDIRRMPEQLDADHRAAVEAGDFEAGQALVDQAAAKAGWAVQEDPLMHGTTQTFNVFSREKARSGNLGRGFYFTNNRGDADANYASEEGADLTNEVERRSELYFNETIDGMTESELISHAKANGISRKTVADIIDKTGMMRARHAVAEAIVRKLLVGGENRIINARVRLQNPAVLNEKSNWARDGWLEPMPVYDEDAIAGELPRLRKELAKEQEIDPSEVDEGELREKAEEWADNNSYYNETPHPLLSAVQEVSRRFDDTNDPSPLIDMLYDEVSLGEVEKVLREEVFVYATDPETGDMETGEAIRQVFEEMGYDGIIDNTVSSKFPNMPNMHEGTTHTVAFSPEQIKSADPFTYDDQGNLIPLSERFNLESDDIRRMPEQLDAEHRAAVEAIKRLYEADKKGEGDALPVFDPARDLATIEGLPEKLKLADDLVREAATAAGFNLVPKYRRTVVDYPSRIDVKTNIGAEHMFTEGYHLLEDPDDFDGIAAEPFYLKEQNPLSITMDDLLAEQERQYPDGGEFGDYDDTLPRDFIDEFIQIALARGHDSLIVKDFDFRDKEFSVHLPLTSSQIASTEIATYDEQGNLIPLSERFNLESDDIRRMPDPVSRIEAERNELKSQKAELVANPVLQISNDVPKQVVDEISGWKVVSKSPYSTSMYDITNKSWGEDPDNFLRVADHWNYKTSADDRIHGRTDIELPPETDWALGRYDADKGTYTILKAWEAAPPATSVSDYRRMQALRKLAAPDSRGFSLSPAQKRLLGRAMQEPVPLEGAVKRMHSNMEYAEALFDEKDGLITASEVGRAALPKGTAGNVSSLRAQKAARRINVNAKPQQAKVLLDRADDDDIRRLPEPKATIEQFKGQNIQVLTSDMSIVQDIARGNKVVTMQGGPGYLDNRGWAFTSKEAAEAFRKRWQNQGQPLIGLTTLTPNNHLNSSDARRAYALRWQQAVKDGTFSKTAANKHVRQAMLRILASEATSSQMAAAKPVAKKIKTVDDLVKLFPTLPWGSSPIFYSKLTAKTVGIKHDKLQDAGLDLEGAANELRQPEFTGAGLGDLFAVARYDGSSPKYRPKLNKAYPWFIPLPDRALLKDMVPVGKLTTDKRVFVKKDVKRGKLSAQPLMTVGVILDKVKEGTLPKVMERKRIKLRPETKRTPSDTAKKIIGQAEAGRIEAFGKRNPMITPTKKAKKKPKKNKR